MTVPEPVADPPSPAADATGPRRPGRSGWLASAGLALVGLLLLVGALVPWWLSHPERVTAWVRRNVPDLHGTVEMARATFTWAGPIVFEDVVVVPRNGRREPVTIRRIEARNGILAFLLSGGDCGRVRVEGLETHVVFDENRDSNLTGLFFDPAAPPKPPAPPKPGGVRMRLEVEDAVARIEGPWSEKAWISEPVDVRLELAHAADGAGNEWTLEPTTLLSEARLEPSVAQGVLAYVAPILADTARTSGRFSLSLEGGRFPVGAPEKATFSGTLTMHEVDLGPGTLVTGVLEKLPGNLQPPTSIRIADDSRIRFRMEERRVWHEGLEVGVPLPRGRRLDLVSSGWVGLDDKALDLKLALPIPDDLPADRPVLASLGGKTVSIGVGGRLGEPRVDFDGSIRGVAADVIVGVIDRLRNKRGGVPSSGAATGDSGAVDRGPTPGWSPQKAGPGDGAPDRGSDGAARGAKTGESVAETDSRGPGAAEPIPPPPPRPGWSPGGSATTAPGRLAGDDTAKPLERDAAAATPPATRSPAASPAEGPGSRAGTAQVLDELRDRIAPQMADDPRADTVIDLVGGIVDQIARRRAERAAAAAPSAAGAQPGAAAESGAANAPPPPGPSAPRRGRLLRRLLQPEGGPPPPPPR